MKKALVAALVLASLLSLAACGGTVWPANGNTAPAETEPAFVIPDSVAINALSGIPYKNSIFTIPLGTLINRAIQGYKVDLYSFDEAVENGLVKKDTLPDYPSERKVYAVVSGEVVLNPEIEFYTRYNDQAVTCLMGFSESGELGHYILALCGDLQTCALLIMAGN